MDTKPVAGLVIHGGAGTILRASLASDQEQSYLHTLRDIVTAGGMLLSSGGSALDAVTLVVSMLEDCPLFNAGKGSVFTSAGTIEMDAAMMNGSNRKAGAVACVKNVRNPVKAARLVMEHSPHVLLVGQGAENYLRQQGIQFEDSAYFQTSQRYAQWLHAQQESSMHLDHDTGDGAGKTGDLPPLDPDKKFGTVGAAALDMHGNLAAATSTGGMTNKLPGRVGDSAMLGAGCFADNRTAAMSATGTGEAFMRSLALHDIAARMQYLGENLEQASNEVILNQLAQYQGRGGMIGIDRQGNIVMPFNTEGMYRAMLRLGEQPCAAIYSDNQDQR